MQVLWWKVTRRAALVSGGTLAALALVRKPRAAADLHDISVLKPVEPPVKPPAFTFTDAQGNRRSLADFAGKGVILNLWATWCMPCVAEMPALDQLAGALAPAGIVVLPLSSDRGGAKAVEQFYKQRGITHLGVWLDPNGEAMHALSARGIPTTLVIDRQGRERGRVEGAVDWSSRGAMEMVRRLAG